MAGLHDPRTLVQRVLVLERQQGFANRAAVGGLEPFGRAQLSRANPGAAPGLEAALNALQGYADLDRHGREAAVAAALHMLLTGVGGPAGTIAQERTVPREPKPSTVADSTSPERVPPADPPTSRPRLSIVHRPEELDSPLSTRKGMRQATLQALARLGVVTVRDLLYYFPRQHFDYTDTRSISRMRVGVPMTLVGRIVDVRLNRTSRDATIVTATIGDESGTVAVRWFNQPYLKRNLQIGARIAITGEPEVRNGYISFVPRDYELIETDDLTHAARLVPVYPLTRGLFQRSLRALIRRVVEEYSSAIEDPLPEELRTRFQLADLRDAIPRFHFPESEAGLSAAQQRLAFDELLLVQLGLLRRKQRWQGHDPSVAIRPDAALLDAFVSALPFQLTGAQTRAIDEMLAEMARPRAMGRLLQGDVGSGKTVVAAALLLQIVKAGRQGVVMAPTEILAEQHATTLRTLLAPFDVRCELLIGSVARTRRNALYQAARDGEIDVLIGTHALIQENLEFRALGLAVTDEQHRFGVEQRATLRSKGLNPHTLAMTATPIPRTLAMTIYGDLDVSTLDELPPGRHPVITTWVRDPWDAYGVIRDEIAAGHQGFVICPVIEESADRDMRSVLAEHRELTTLIFPQFKVGLLHGRMKPREKERVLGDFRVGEYDILVATSVVEVGIDIPNATAMVIRDAHRFGLAQLHQFRGRVGRGGDQAFCVLLSDAEGEEANQRLEALAALDDGFELAREDLRLRGPGEFWGTRQSGLPELKVATLGDLHTVELAQRAAREILTDDPELTLPRHAVLGDTLERFWAEAADVS